MTAHAHDIIDLDRPAQGLIDFFPVWRTYHASAAVALLLPALVLFVALPTGNDTMAAIGFLLLFASAAALAQLADVETLDRGVLGWCGQQCGLALAAHWIVILALLADVRADQLGIAATAAPAACLTLTMFLNTSMAAGLLRVLQLPDATRRAIAPHRSKWSDLLTLPGTTKALPPWSARRLLATALFALSGTLKASGVMVVFFVGTAWEDMRKLSSLSRSEEIWFAGAAVALFFVSSAASNVLLRWGRTYSCVSFENVRKRDKRKPVVFLRPFRDDQVRLNLPKLNFAQRLAFFGMRDRSLDHLLVEEAWPHGPVVALGRPEQLHVPYGAARLYAADGDWQREVAQLFEDPRAVVLCFDDTRGILWEVDHLRQSGMFARTLILLHPRLSDERANASAVAQIVDPMAHAALSGNERVLGIRFDDAGRPCFMTATEFSIAHYQAAIRMFLRDSAGAEGVALRHGRDQNRTST